MFVCSEFLSSVTLHVRSLVPVCMFFLGPITTKTCSIVLRTSLWRSLAAAVGATPTAHCGIPDGHRYTGKDQVKTVVVSITDESIGVLELQALLIPLTKAFCNDGAQDAKARAFAMHTHHPDKPPIPDDVKESWLKFVIPRLQQYGQFFKRILLVAEGPHGGLGKAPTNRKRMEKREKAYLAAIGNVSNAGMFVSYYCLSHRNLCNC